MNTYKVLQHDSKELKAVKAGFAWLAIPFITCLPIFPVWFLFRGLWKIFIAYILTILILASIDYELYGYVGFFNFSTADKNNSGVAEITQSNSSFTLVL